MEGLCSIGDRSNVWSAARVFMACPFVLSSKAP